MTKVVLQGYILIPDVDLDAVSQALDTHIALTRTEPGCLVFDVLPNGENANRFDVYEEFVDTAAFDVHQARVRASEWGQIAANVERHYTVEGLEH